MSAVRARHRPPFLPAPTVRTGPCLAGTAPCIARHGVATDRLTCAASSAWRLVPVLSKMSLSLVRAVSKEMLSAASRSASPVPIRARRAAPPMGSARKPFTASPRPPCSRRLIYDQNGNIAGGGVHFATLDAGHAMTNADFFIVRDGAGELPFSARQASRGGNGISQMLDARSSSFFSSAVFSRASRS